jgi:nicotinate-nucleotide pyrophosphorylase (carboxylating)
MSGAEHPPGNLLRQQAGRLLEMALDEDLGRAGDLTTAATVPEPTRVTARLEAREPLVVAGLPLAEPLLERVAARGLGEASFVTLADEGDRVEQGTELGRLEGSAWAVLAAERLLLNLVGRLSGVASATAECVAEVSGTRTTIADTRKTTPGLRSLEKYAVAVGGGENHRPGLDSMILVKDNHKQIAGGMHGVIERLRAHGARLDKVEVEVEDLEEARLAAEAGFGWILLDNMGLDIIGRAVELIAGRSRVEVSGGLRPGVLRPLAEAGADRLSLGWLTHGVRSVDVAIEIDPES